MRMGTSTGLLVSLLFSAIALTSCDDGQQPASGGAGGTGGTGGTGMTTGGTGGTGGMTGGTGGTTGGGGTGGTGGTGGMACTSPTDCPDTGNECVDRTCDNGACGTAVKPAGTPSANQTAGDCKIFECNDAGTLEAHDDNGDLPSDQNDCTTDTCVAGAPLHDPSPAGTVCASNGGKLCDGAGSCVECLMAGDCTSGVCNADSTCALGDCADNILNGAETDIDCGGPVCAKCLTDKACLTGADCIDGVCDDATKLCAAPSCTDSVKNGTETDVDCGGACPGCADGSLCMTSADCTSTYCYGNPLSCQSMLNGCTLATAVDMTGQPMVTITFGGFFYTPKCVKVSPGTQVTWSGTFTSHPLQGGAVVNNVPFPDSSTIPLTNSGTTKTIGFDATGSYPYYCQFHVNSMQGVVFVE